MLWLVNNANNIYIYNNQSLITSYHKKPIQRTELTADKILLGQENVCFYLNLKKKKNASSLT